jgi:hypothetical protein
MEVSMYRSPLYIRQHRWIISGAYSLASVLAIVAALSGGCRKDSAPAASVEQNISPQIQSPGEEFLIGLLDELNAIADAGAQAPNVSTRRFRHESPGGMSLDARKLLISSTATDTTFIYGEITPDGFGAVVTERHQYPKGLLLITVRKTHGKPQGGIVSETRKYISFADLARDSAQQSNITEVYALTRDTIVTHVLRNGTLETYTFRLPVVTRVVNPRDGSVRVTSRFGSGGTVVSEVRDGAGGLIQVRKNSGLADGSVVSYALFADSTWRSIRTIGQADGTVFREITSGP